MVKNVIYSSTRIQESLGRKILCVKWRVATGGGGRERR